MCHCNMILFAVLISFILSVKVQIVGSKSISIVSNDNSDITNDNFCDNLVDGRDETATSACSHIQSTLNVFTCIDSSGLFNKTIPTSRVNDGVCDCCDGSDEKNKHITSMYMNKCLNTCQDDIVSIRQQALANYRSIQVNLRVKYDLLEEFRKQTSRTMKAYKKQVEEKDDVEKLIVFIKLHLRTEEYLESRIRSKLLRERQINCALGDVEYCNYYNSTFYSDNELRNVGINAKLANPKTKVRYGHSKEELAYLSTLNGVERIRAQLCPYESLLPDDDKRLHSTAGEYITFMKSPGGQSHYKHYYTQIQKEYLFQDYLEDEGYDGLLKFTIVLTEIITAPISPVVLAVHGLLYGYSLLGQAVWEYIIQCSDSNEICYHLLHLYDEDSIYTTLISYIDRNENEYIDFMLTLSTPITCIPYFIATTIWTYPLMYYQYYFTSLSHQLPPRRNACLLRESSKTAQDEYSRLMETLRHEEAVQKDRDNLYLGSGQKRGVSKDGKDSKKYKFIDYGVNGEWEIMKDVCIENHIGEYKYKFCFFNDIKQNGTIIGKFDRWGSGDSSSTGSDVSNYYKTQYYSKGLQCQLRKGVHREANVIYQCSRVNEIVSVDETEICKYVVHINSPIACEQADETKALQLLDDLGVFGFTSRDRKKQ